MLQYFVYLIFILTVAMAAGGVVLASKLRDKYNNDIFSTLLYFQVFIYTFGFYGIWGQIVVKTFLTDFVSPEAITRFTDISMLLGLPFLVFAWLMLLKFSSEISGRRSNNLFVFWFLLVNFLIIIGVGYIVSGKTGSKPLSLVRYYFLILNFFYTLIASILFLFSRRNKAALAKNENLVIAVSIFIFMLLQGIILYFYESEQITGMIFIFIFFAGNAFLPVYLSYGIIIPQTLDELSDSTAIENFCKIYEVSPRESEIIREICNGLSNKEISDKLFISLQTVKDHTHRIYIKTNVKSRAQLMNLVKGF